MTEISTRSCCKDGKFSRRHAIVAQVNLVFVASSVSSLHLMIRETLSAVVAFNKDVGTHACSVWISSLEPILMPIRAQLLLWSRRRRRSLLLSLFNWSRLLRFFDWCRLLCLFYWSRSRRLLSCWGPELEGLVESRDKFALVTGCPREEFHGRERDRTII